MSSLPGEGREIIHLHPAAPAKPAEGEPCNGCGVCCALETCPVARLRFLQRRGPCPALRWSVSDGRYHCGLLLAPKDYFFLPEAWVPRARQWLAGRIAAGVGCDCSAEVEGSPEA